MLYLRRLIGTYIKNIFILYNFLCQFLKALHKTVVGNIFTWLFLIRKAHLRYVLRLMITVINCVSFFILSFFSIYSMSFTVLYAVQTQ